MDLEHVLVMLPDFTPAGAGRCNVCEDCPAFREPTVGPSRAEQQIAKKEALHESLRKEGQMQFVNRMVNDTSFQDVVNEQVTVSRAGFNLEYLAALRADKKVDYAAIATTCSLLLRDYRFLGFYPEGKKERRKRRKAIVMTWFAIRVARFLAWVNPDKTNEGMLEQS
jgi:hypothetical protein